MHRGLSLAAVVLVLASGCVNGYLVNRDLHYVVDEEGNEQLVRTDSPPPAAYEAYLRARFALEGTPPDLELAHEQIRIALRWRPREAQLWLVLAEVELPSEDVQPRLPDWLAPYVVREVTGEPEYLNMNLAR